MLRCVGTIILLVQCTHATAQWSSFKPVTKELIPRDQREINQQTVAEGNVIPKEIRVDWYGFTMKNGTNVVQDRYQYPVSDPVLATGDKIVRVRTTDVTDADQVTKALRESPDTDSVSISVERILDGTTKLVKITLYRANSILLNRLLNDDVGIQPPVPLSGKPGVWGEASSLSFKLVTIADNGEGIFRGSIRVPELDERRRRSGSVRGVHVEHAVLRGWNVAGLSVGDPAELYRCATNPDHVVPAEVPRLVMGTGSSGIPKEKTKGGIGFLSAGSIYKPNLVIGIGENEILKVDGKDLQVNVLVNME